jgi:DNA-binding NarL/FixJ family response regulator
MASKITITERQLIDDAIAAGRVTKVPQGVSGQSLHAKSWLEMRNVSHAQYLKIQRLRAAKEREPARGLLTPRKTGESVVIDERIKIMIGQGLTYQAIGDSMGLSNSAIAKRVRRMKEKGVL